MDKIKRELLGQHGYITSQLQRLNKRLANAKGPCDCSVLWLRPKSSLCSYRHYILDTTSLGHADSMHCASNDWVGQFKPILQVEANTFRPVFFGYFIVDCSTILLLQVFTQWNFVADFVRLKLNFIPKNWKIGFWVPFGGVRGNVCTPSIARWKPMVNFLFIIIEFFTISYSWDVISGDLSKSAFFKGVG